MAKRNQETKILFLIIILVFVSGEVFAVPVKASVEVSLRPHLEYDAGGTRDPFGDVLGQPEEQRVSAEGELAAGSQAAPLPTLSIQGLIWGGRFPQAIVNGKVVRIGDAVEGAQITDINKEGIVLFYDNRRHILRPPAMVNLKKALE